MTSSLLAAAQPPWSKPPRVSSPGEEGDCMTPSSVRWLTTTIRMMLLPCGTGPYSTAVRTGLSSTMWISSRMTASRPKQPRSERKGRAILEAAKETFLRKGYLGTTMDEIAAGAAVSKQTVYKHFSDKEGLFTEIVTGAVDEVSDPHHEDVLVLGA